MYKVNVINMEIIKYRNKLPTEKCFNFRIIINNNNPNETATPTVPNIAKI